MSTILENNYYSKNAQSCILIAHPVTVYQMKRAKARVDEILGENNTGGRGCWSCDFDKIDKTQNSGVSQSATFD